MAPDTYLFVIEFLDDNRGIIERRTIRARDLTQAVGMAARRTISHVSAVGFVVGAAEQGEVTDAQTRKVAR